MNRSKNIIKADKAYEIGIYGEGVTIAILDTGIAKLEDFTSPYNRIIAFHDLVNKKKEPYDDNGHGTHVAGIVAGNGAKSKGLYSGIAPRANIIVIKILDKLGNGNTSDAIAGIQWLIDNKDTYNIRIANLSIGTTSTDETDPLVRACEAAWDRGIIITIAAGNNGPKRNSITSPGISRKVITVGSSDDSNDLKSQGKLVKNFSGRGPTPDCIIKPDIVAPGTNIISCAVPDIDHIVGSISKKISKYYLQMSGTSMSTPIVTGAIALLLEKIPTLTPNQVKLILKDSTDDLKYPQNHQGWGLINIDKLINGGINHVDI
jgi:serine protease AprX